MEPDASGAPPRGPILALDVDGVLLDPARAGRGSWQEALREHYGVDPSRLDAVFFQRSWSAVVVGREPVEAALARALAELDWDIDVEALLQTWSATDLEIDHDVVRAVDGWATSGVRLVIVTNQEVRRARFLERVLTGILPIDGMAFSGALGTVKSDPAFYPAAERSLGIDGLRNGCRVRGRLARQYRSRASPRLAWSPLRQAIRLAHPDHVGT